VSQPDEQGGEIQLDGSAIGLITWARSPALIAPPPQMQNDRYAPKRYWSSGTVRRFRQMFRSMPASFATLHSNDGSSGLTLAGTAAGLGARRCGLARTPFVSWCIIGSG
jgi:hypothetical protein